MNFEGKHVIKFSASWCGPCKVYSPIFEEAVESLGSDVSIHRLDADENSDLLEKFSVRGVPTTLLIKDGEVLSTLVGVKNKEELSKNFNLL